MQWTAPSPTAINEAFTLTLWRALTYPALSQFEDFLALSREPGLAPHVLGEAPAWLWAVDPGRILWANVAGAAVFGAESPMQLIQRNAAGTLTADRELARLMGSLPTSGASQLARLRGFGSPIAPPRLCACARYRPAGGAAAMLIVATDAGRAPLSAEERLRRTLLDWPEAVAFSRDGFVLAARPDAPELLRTAATLADLEANDLGAAALAFGSASGLTDAGLMTLERLGEVPDAVLVATVWNADDIGFDDEDAAADQGEQADTTSAPPLADVLSSADLLASEAVQIQPAPAGESNPTPSTTIASDPVFVRTSAPSLAALAELEERLVQRRHPLRFIWKLDLTGHFSIEPGDFLTLAGSTTAAVLGRTWPEVAQELGLEGGDRVTRALESRDTWSGITLTWPIVGLDERLPVTLSGLPLSGGERSFAGYQGFGICRAVAVIAAAIAVRRDSVAARAAETQSESCERIAQPAPAAVTETTGSPVAESAAEGPAAPRHEAQISARSAPELKPAGAHTQTSNVRGPGPAGRRQLTLVPAARNVVPLRAGAPGDKRTALSPVERSAFQEIARALGARLEGELNAANPTPPEHPAPLAAASRSPDPALVAEPMPAPAARKLSAQAPESARTEAPSHTAPTAAPVGATSRLEVGEKSAPAGHYPGLDRAVLDRLPVAVLVYRADTLLLANRTFLEWTGFESTDAVAAAGGLEALFVSPALAAEDEIGAPQATTICRADGQPLAIDARLSTIPLNGGPALMWILTRHGRENRDGAADALLAAQARARELTAVLDTAADGVIVIDGEARVLAVSRGAEALFGYEAAELAGQSLVALFAPESEREAADYFEALTRRGVASLLNDGREVIGRVREGGLVPLFMTMGQIAERPDKFCAVFRDLTSRKRAEEELLTARRQADRTAAARLGFLEKVGHEIRGPLGAIVAWAEALLEEDFATDAGEHARECIDGIHSTGADLIGLVGDLLELARIEAGKLDLIFGSVDLNAVMRQSVALAQPQANNDRIIIRTALSPSLPPVVADERTVRQIAANLLAHSIRFTGAGGQVIVSTALTDTGEAVLRVRDTGPGMNQHDIEAALSPFAPGTSGTPTAVGSRIGLPLTKALAEANRAAFQVRSAVNSGTLIEIVFPSTRVLAE